MVYFQTKNPNLGNFWSALDWNMLVYVMAVWNISKAFGLPFGHLVDFVFIWYILCSFGTFCVHLVHFSSCSRKNLATPTANAMHLRRPWECGNAP
jgi:hypothetical protein